MPWACLVMTRHAPMPCVMLAAHMDGRHMLTRDDENGLYQFGLVGGMDERVLVGKPILVSKSHIPGVIGASPFTCRNGEHNRPSCRTIAH